MTPVDQTIFGPRGNCLQACVASILEVPLRAVPNFAEGPNAHDFHDNLRRWLSPGRLIDIEWVEDYPVHRAFFGEAPGPVLLWGASPRGSGAQHAVVGQVGLAYGAKIIHDPHPSRAGLEGVPWGVAWIIPARGLNP